MSAPDQRPPGWPVTLGLLATVGGAVGFVVAFARDASLGWLGGSLMAALLGLGLALAYWGRDLAGDEVLTGPYPIPNEDPEAQTALADGLQEGAQVLTRRSFLTKLLVLAAAAFALSQVALAFALGPRPKKDRRATAWRPGVALMTVDGRTVTREALAAGGFLVAFPEGHADAADSQVALLHFVDGDYTPRGRARELEPRGVRRLLASVHPRRVRGGPIRGRGRSPGVPLPPVDLRRARRRAAPQRARRAGASAAPPGDRRGGAPRRPERLHRARRPRRLERDVSGRRLLRSMGSSFGVRRSPLRRAARWLDINVGGGRVVRDELRHVFPDSWAFFLGEIALYCFLVLVATGVFLALFFRPSEAQVVYEGSYQPLAGVRMSDAYSSVVELSLDVRAGLLVRQVHHWAALVFVAALMIHLLRMFFTGAYRRPRRVNWLIGLTLLLLVAGNGLFGLLAARRPALGHGSADLVRDHRVDPVRRALAGVADVRRRVPVRRSHRAHLPGPHLPAAGRHRRTAQPPSRPPLAAAPHRVPRPGAGRPHRGRDADGARLRAAHHRLPLPLRGGADGDGQLPADQPRLALRAVSRLGRDDERSARLVHGMARRARCA